MKYIHGHYKFTTKSRRFKETVWLKYYSLKKQKTLNEYDKFWMRQFRQNLKTNQIKLIGEHLPSKTKTEWIIQKEKINKKEYVKQLLAKVKENRKIARTAKVVDNHFEGASYRTIGGVFVGKGTIKTLGPYLTTNDPRMPKKPRHAKKNYIGIELEFNEGGGWTINDIAGRLKDAGLARYVDVGTDGSCGWEVRVLLQEEEFETPLKQILTVLNSMGFLTDENCGTHVHFDMRNRNVNLVYENLFKTQKFLRKFLTKKRKRNEYCKMNKADTFDKQLSIGDRRYSLNVQAYKEHKTIEVRMHQGTLVASELIPWIKLLAKIINHHPNPLDKGVNTLKDAKARFALDEALTKELEEKIRKVFTSRPKVATPDVPRMARQQDLFGQFINRTLRG